MCNSRLSGEVRCRQFQACWAAILLQSIGGLLLPSGANAVPLKHPQISPTDDDGSSLVHRSLGSVRAEYNTETQLKSLSRALKTRTVAYSKAKAAGTSVAWEDSACAVLVTSVQTDAATASAQTRTLSQLPNRSTIQQCSDEYGTSVHDSGMLEEVLSTSSTPVKAMKLQSSAPAEMAMPESDSMTNDTVIMIDCGGDSWIDFRQMEERVDTISILYRCGVLLGDSSPPFMQSWLIDSSEYQPCNNTADPSTPDLVVLEEGLPMYSHTYEGDMSSHRFNVTMGCWTAAAIASLYTQTSGEMPIIVNTSKGEAFWDAVPLWVWLLAGAVALALATGAIVWCKRRHHHADSDCVCLSINGNDSSKHESAGSKSHELQDDHGPNHYGSEAAESSESAETVSTVESSRAAAQPAERAEEVKRREITFTAWVEPTEGTIGYRMNRMVQKILRTSQCGSGKFETSSAELPPAKKKEKSPSNHPEESRCSVTFGERWTHTTPSMHMFHRDAELDSPPKASSQSNFVSLNSEMLNRPIPKPSFPPAPPSLRVIVGSPDGTESSAGIPMPPGHAFAAAVDAYAEENRRRPLQPPHPHRRSSPIATATLSASAPNASWVQVRPRSDEDLVCVSHSHTRSHSHSHSQYHSRSLGLEAPRMSSDSLHNRLEYPQKPHLCAHPSVGYFWHSDGQCSHSVSIGDSDVSIQEHSHFDPGVDGGCRSPRAIRSPRGVRSPRVVQSPGSPRSPNGLGCSNGSWWYDTEYYVPKSSLTKSKSIGRDLQHAH